MNSRLSNQNKHSRYLIFVLAAALIVRVLYLYLYQQLPDWSQLTVDNWYHVHWAQSIAGGNLLGDTTYFRAPFYIYCLAVLYAVVGVSLWVGRLFGLAVGLASIFMTFRLGKRLFNSRVGLISAAIHAIYPVILYFESELLLDPLFMLLLQIAIYKFLGWMDEAGNDDLVWSGLMFGLAAITRPTALVIVIVAMVVVLIRSGQIKTRLTRLAMLALAAAAVIVPITLRNYVVASDPVLIASQGGINFYIGNNAHADGTSAIMPPPLGHNWRLEDVEYIAEQDAGKELAPGEESSYWFGRGLSEIADDPGRFAGLFLKKLYLNLSDREVSNNRSLGAFFDRIPLLSYNPLSFGSVFGLAALGIMLAWGSDRKVRFVVVSLAVYVLATALFFFSSRFRLPLLPYYIILAVYAVFAVIRMIALHRAKAVGALAGAAVVAVLSYLPLVAPSGAVSTQDLLSKGLMYMNDGQFSIAAQHYHRALELNDQFPTTNLNLGICYLRMGVEDSAFYYFDREKALHPDRSKAYINSAALHLVNNRFDETIGEINRALELRPYDITANTIFLRAHAGAGADADSLWKLAAIAAARTRNDIYVLNEAASLLTASGGPDKAEFFLTLAIESSPPPIETDNTAFDADFRNSPEKLNRERARAHYQLGYLIGMRGDFARSVEHSLSAIEFNPELAEAYVNLVSGYGSLGNYRAADSVLSVAESTFPRNQQIQSLRQAISR